MMAQDAASAFNFTGTTPTLRNWTEGASSCSLFSASLVNVESVENGQVCILECKVLFILQEIVPVSKGNVSPSWFFPFLFYDL